MSRTTIKRTAVVAPLAAAALLAALLESTGGAQQPGERTFKLILKDESAALGDVAPTSRNQRDPRISGGDQHVFTSTVFDEAQKRVGKFYGQCVAVRGGRTYRQSTFQCQGTFVLRDGAIAVSVAFRATQRDEDVSLAVIGGTGAYEGARGQVSTRILPGGREEKTVHLLP
jgi:hypothetical protein